MRLSAKYQVVCNPLLLRRSPSEYALPEPAVEMEADVLTAFARAKGNVVLHEKVWSESTALRNGLRHVNGISSHRNGWLVFPISALSSEKARQVLWWASIVAPLTFFLEPECPREALTWFVGAWPEVGTREREILIDSSRDLVEKLSDLLGLMLDYVALAEPAALVGFFDEGNQVVV